LFPVALLACVHLYGVLYALGVCALDKLESGCGVSIGLAGVIGGILVIGLFGTAVATLNEFLTRGITQVPNPNPHRRSTRGSRPR
jgi:hypothetical protein